jgi:mitochondrial import inner membrane translocase subunit TIM13
MESRTKVNSHLLPDLLTIESATYPHKAQNLIQTSTEKCYAKCVPSPGGSLSSKEETCLERCMERYFEAFNIVSQTYVRRVASERNAGATLGQTPLGA